jgi:hypothetical protein
MATQQIEKSKAIETQKISKELFKFIRSIEKQILDKNREQIFENSKDINEQAIGFYSMLLSDHKGRKKKGEPSMVKILKIQSNVHAGSV